MSAVGLRQMQQLARTAAANTTPDATAPDQLLAWLEWLRLCRAPHRYQSPLSRHVAALGITRRSA